MRRRAEEIVSVREELDQYTLSGHEAIETLNQTLETDQREFSELKNKVEEHIAPLKDLASLELAGLWLAVVTRDDKWRWENPATVSCFFALQQLTPGNRGIHALFREVRGKGKIGANRSRCVEEFPAWYWVSPEHAAARAPNWLAATFSRCRHPVVSPRECLQACTNLASVEV